MRGAACPRRVAPAFVAALAVTLDATRARAGSLARETAVMAADRRRVPILVAVCLAMILALVGHLVFNARPASAKMRLGFGVPLFLVSTYWLAFEGGCPFVWPRGGIWNAPVDLRLVLAASGATVIAIGSLWIAWRRRGRSRH